MAGRRGLWEGQSREHTEDTGSSRELPDIGRLLSIGYGPVAHDDGRLAEGGGSHKGTGNRDVDDEGAILLFSRR